MAQSEFLKAFQGKNTKVPVWFMRQAGRSLPQYQALREHYSLAEMFSNADLVAKVTCLPVEVLEVDAAILFADILTLPKHMGFEINFDKNHGPVILNQIKHVNDVKTIRDFEGVEYLGKAIRAINEQLPGSVPLIGFAGAPFTVLTYLLEGGSSATFAKTLNFLYTQTQTYAKLMEKLTKNTISYLNYQKRAGIKVFQLFDTWAGQLSADVYGQYVLPYVQKIFKAVDLPSIYYVKNCSHVLALMDKTDADFLSVCHTVNLSENGVLAKTKKGVQGNLFTGLLYSDAKTLKQETNALLKSAKKYKRYIFNLSHGVNPDVQVEKLRTVVEAVHAFTWPAA
ncbi:MAG: uroporphyrinogen decarboxylase [Omnitrophica WOR_2 bacterium GWA2_47_8]|nr:MAG: uroporphyrinogen decarboxylase [Omnitrophica WOR_2 bacterium GWA2_47_8]